MAGFGRPAYVPGGGGQQPFQFSVADSIKNYEANLAQHGGPDIRAQNLASIPAPPAPAPQPSQPAPAPMPAPAPAPVQQSTYDDSGKHGAPTPAPAPAPAAPTPAPAPAPPQGATNTLMALAGGNEPLDAGAGWASVATPGQTRPGLGQRLPFVPGGSAGIRY